MSMIDNNEEVYQFEQTSIPTQYTANLADNYGYLWVDSRTADFYKLLVSTIADFLHAYRDKSKERIGVKIKDANGNFKIGGIMSYHKPEDDSEDDSGNWFLELTFYEDDMTDLDLELDNHCDTYVRSLSYVMDSIFHGRYKSIECISNMTNEAVDVLKAFLDVNACPGKIVTIVLKGYFSASVAIENEEKVMSITPGECVKQLIKDDASL